MSTEKQTNAQKTTGPTSFRTGLFAESLVARREDEEHVRQLAREYYTFYNPATPVERDLVDMLIRDIHLIRRLTRAETSLWNHQWESLDRAVSADAEHGAAAKNAGLDFGRIQRRLNQLDRNFHETRAMLESLQERRRAALDAEPGPVPFEGEAIQPEPDYFTPKSADSKPTSPEIGFVPSNSPEPGPDPPSQEIGIVPPTPIETPPQAFGFVPSTSPAAPSPPGGFVKYAAPVESSGPINGATLEEP